MKSLERVGSSEGGGEKKMGLNPRILPDAIDKVLGKRIGGIDWREARFWLCCSCMSSLSLWILVVLLHSPII